MKGCKICAIKDLDTLNFIINHPYPPQFIGFICNYKKSSRYVDIEKLNELLTIDKKKSNFFKIPHICPFRPLSYHLKMLGEWRGERVKWVVGENILDFCSLYAPDSIQYQLFV